jgi:hypothetical protein
LGELKDNYHEEAEQHRLKANQLQKLTNQNAALKENVAKL